MYGSGLGYGYGYGPGFYNRGFFRGYMAAGIGYPYGALALPCYGYGFGYPSCGIGYPGYMY